MEIRLKEGSKKNFEGKYHNVKVKILKQRYYTYICVYFLTLKKKKIKNKIKFHKVYKIYHYNITIEFSVYFSFLFLYSKEAK